MLHCIKNTSAVYILGTVNETDHYCIYTVPHSQLLQPLTVLLHLEQVEQISNVQLG